MLMSKCAHKTASQANVHDHARELSALPIIPHHSGGTRADARPCTWHASTTCSPSARACCPREPQLTCTMRRAAGRFCNAADATAMPRCCGVFADAGTVRHTRLYGLWLSLSATLFDDGVLTWDQDCHRMAAEFDRKFVSGGTCSSQSLRA